MLTMQQEETPSVTNPKLQSGGTSPIPLGKWRSDGGVVVSGGALVDAGSSFLLPYIRVCTCAAVPRSRRLSRLWVLPATHYHHHHHHHLLLLLFWILFCHEDLSVLPENLKFLRPICNSCQKISLKAAPEHFSCMYVFMSVLHVFFRICKPYVCVFCFEHTSLLMFKQCKTPHRQSFFFPSCKKESESGKRKSGRQCIV